MNARPVGTLVAYIALGTALFASRLLALGHSFWTDEIGMVAGYVRQGPRYILTGPDLSHELLALLTWATSEVVGESEIAFRLWSAVPFVAGVVFMTAWLHRRIDPLSGVLFLFLATVSPLLLDITRQARGYGIAFLAMTVVIGAALDAVRTGKAWAVVAMCAAGVVGAWTLPQFAFAFGAVALVVAFHRCVRLAAVIGLVVSIAAIYVWYAPHSSEVQSASQIQDGVQVGFPWVLTAPIDQVLIPALIWIDGTALVAGMIWLPLVVLAAVVMGSSQLIRTRSSALILCSGPVATIFALWMADAYVIPRYLSYLLVPLFVLLATGASSILGRIRTRRTALRTIACLVVLGILAVRFAATAPDVLRFPREAHRDAAEVIARTGAPTSLVLAYMRRPANLEFYLGRPVVDLEPDEVAERVCGADRVVFYVMQPFALDDVTVPCLDRNGVRHYRFRQYARGGEMNVWLVPAA